MNPVNPVILSDIISGSMGAAWVPETVRARGGALEYRFRFTESERQVYRRRRRMRVSEWCERHRVITMGPLKGNRWHNHVTPYLAGIMDASFFPTVRQVVVCAAPQVGKSEAVNNCLGYAVDRQPGEALIVYPDELTAKENSKDRIRPMLVESPRLRGYLTGSQDDEAVMRLNLQHMIIYMAWARSAARLANKPIRYIVMDEVDKYPATAGAREADPISLGEKRSTTYSMLGQRIWKLSTPTVENGPIWTALTQECQAVFDYHVRCPACGSMQVMGFDRIRWPEEYKDDPVGMETARPARYSCAACPAMWDDMGRDAAVRNGEWGERKRPGQDNRMDGIGMELGEYLEKKRPANIGFHIPSWLSTFVSMSKAAAAFVRGKTDKNKLKDFKNNHCAEPWKDYTAERSENRLLSLRDDRPRGLVPGAVSCLTAGVDTQDDGFWYEIRAWGYGLTLASWQVREGFVTEFDALSEILWAGAYLDGAGNEHMVRLTVQDAMGHRTAAVYDFARMNRGRLLPLKGEKRMNQPVVWSKLDTYPGTNKPIPGGLKLVRADVNYYKNLLAGKLEINPADPGAWLFHAETTEEWVRHMTAEHIDESGIWVCPDNRANHGWDCSVYNLVAADVLGVKFWKEQAEGGRSKAEGRREEEKGKGWIPRSGKGKWL